MDAAHGLGVADAAMGGGVVIGRVDIDKGEAQLLAVVALVAAAQQLHLPAAKRAGAVVKQGEIGHARDLREPGRAVVGRAVVGRAPLPRQTQLPPLADEPFLAP